MNALQKQEAVKPDKKNQTFIQQAFNFWLLARLIRRGWKDPKTSKVRILTSEEMIARITHYLDTFHWSDSVLAKISELQTLAYKKMREENASRVKANS